MNRSLSLNRSLSPFAAMALLSTTLFAQDPPADPRTDPPAVLAGTMLVRIAPDGLRLNDALLHQLGDEAAFRGALGRPLGRPLLDRPQVFTVGGDQPPGTFVVSYQIFVSPGEVPADAGTRVGALLRDHLQQQLQALLYQDRRAELGQRRSQLQQDLVAATRAAFQQRGIEAAPRDAEATLQRQRQPLADQEQDARLSVATETQVRQYLAERRVVAAAYREDLQKERAAAANEGADLEPRLAEARRRLDTLLQQAQSNLRPDTARQDRQETDELLAMSHKTEALLAQRSQRLRAIDEKLALHDRQTAAVLEQLPACELLLRRSEARLQSLAEEHKRLADAEAMLDQRRQRAAVDAAEAELRQIELQGLRDQLAAVQRELGLLQPPRVDLLGPR